MMPLLLNNFLRFIEIRKRVEEELAARVRHLLFFDS